MYNTHRGINEHDSLFLKLLNLLFHIFQRKIIFALKEKIFHDIFL